MASISPEISTLLGLLEVETAVVVFLSLFTILSAGFLICLMYALLGGLLPFFSISSFILS